MKKVLVLFGLGFAVAATLFASLSYHFILTSKRLVVERKSELSFKNTFVDTRDWGFTDYLKNPEIGAIVAGRGLKGAFGGSRSAADEAKEASKEVLEKSKKALDDGLEQVQKKLRE